MGCHAGDDANCNYTHDNHGGVGGGCDGGDVVDSGDGGAGGVDDGGGVGDVAGGEGVGVGVGPDAGAGVGLRFGLGLFFILKVTSFCSSNSINSSRTGPYGTGPKRAEASEKI